MDKMIIVNTKGDIEELISNNKMVLIYFGGNGCNVCTAMKPKVQELLKNYPEIKSVQVEVEKSLEISAFYNIFTIPAILIYIEGKEIIREARHITLQDISSRVERYYSMLFGE